VAIIRDDETDWTAELTDIDMVLWLCLVKGLEMQEAFDTAKLNKDRAFFVRLPPSVKTTDQLTTHTRSVV
jgi:hypothetical protein|tara:strand:+ start:763 stop:972 length:210 start_codon:yes stop_codon:yes gene_type:complete